MVGSGNSDLASAAYGQRVVGGVESHGHVVKAGGGEVRGVGTGDKRIGFTGFNLRNGTIRTPVVGLAPVCIGDFELFAGSNSDIVNRIDFTVGGFEFPVGGSTPVVDCAADVQGCGCIGIPVGSRAGNVCKSFVDSEGGLSAGERSGDVGIPVYELTGRGFSLGVFVLVSTLHAYASGVESIPDSAALDGRNFEIGGTSVGVNSVGGLDSDRIGDVPALVLAYDVDRGVS